MQDMQEDFFLFQIWERLLWKVMLNGRNMLVLWKYLKEHSLLVTLKKKEVSTEKCSSEKGGETSSGLAFSRKTEQESKSAEKNGIVERATQSWDLVGTEVSNVTFLLQFSLWYCWCIQGYVSRHQHCSRNVLWANKTVILNHLWNCILLKHLLVNDLKKGSMFYGIV